MRILAIETSCDETAVALVSFDKENGKTTYCVINEKLYSQAARHAPYGGVYPNLAKREHQHNLPLLLKELLDEETLLTDDLSIRCTDTMKDMCKKDVILFETIKKLFDQKRVTGIDRIAVTQGPGLSPALWVGVNAAKLFSLLWNIPVIPTNHMEGHIAAALIDDNAHIVTPPYPLLSLLVSGGHTQFVFTEKEGTHQIIGHSVDDAVGEAFDKVARLLGLPYPGGPEIARLANEARHRNLTSTVSLPRPMLKDPSYNVSFAGLKTAVRVKTEGRSLHKDEMLALAREFEDAITETLTTKLQRAIEDQSPRSLVLGGGVSANQHLRKAVEQVVHRYPSIAYFQPTTKQATDNAVMIALAAYTRQTPITNLNNLTAKPNLSFTMVPNQIP